MAHGFQHRLDSVRDSIASLFKRRSGSRSKNGGRGKNDGRISTPQNVKRVMHITFDPCNQSFEGIPNNWRNYFEGQQTSNPSSAEAAALEASRVPAEDQYAAVDRAASRTHATVDEYVVVDHAASRTPATMDEYAVVDRAASRTPATVDEYAVVGCAVSPKPMPSSFSALEHASRPAQHPATEDEYAVIERARAKSSAEVPPKLAGSVAHHTAEDHRGWGYATRAHDTQDRVSWKYETSSKSYLLSSGSGNLQFEESQDRAITEETDHSADGRPENAAGAYSQDLAKHPEHPSDRNTVHTEEHPTHAMTFDSTEHSEEHFPHAANNNADHSEGHIEHADDPQAEHPKNASTHEASELALGDLTLTELASSERTTADNHAALEVEPRRAHLSASETTNEDTRGEASADAPARMESQLLRAPRELLSLVYDRDNGRFVNLPPHWEERLVRNNLLETEFHTNPRLLALVFGMMDQELRSMRTEGERVESCMYSSTLPARSQSRSRENRPYVFRIEADKSNSSSEIDLSSDQQAIRQQQQKQQQQQHQHQHQEQQAAATTAAQRSASMIEAQLVKGNRQRKVQRGSSFVVIKAVEVPDELDEE